MSIFPTKAQAEILSDHGLMPFAYVVLYDGPEVMIVVRYIDGALKSIEKTLHPNK